MKEPKYILNENEKIVEAIRKRLIITGGYCPCVPQEKWNEDTLCACKAYREEGYCCCKLYQE